MSIFAFAEAELSKYRLHRAALSCITCKSRKIKCDRQLPCEACVKRGKANECTYDTIVHEEPLRQYASVGELQQIQSRLKRIEAALCLPAFDDAPTADIAISPPDSYALPANTYEANRSRYQPNLDVSALDSDTEDAAITLEEMTMDKARASTSWSDLGPPAFEPEARLQTPSTTLHGSPRMQNMYPFDFTRTPGLTVQSSADRVGAVLQNVNLDPRVTDYLLNFYCDHVAWHWNVLHLESLRTEYAKFKHACLFSAVSSIDPLFVTLLLIILSLAANHLPKSRGLSEATGMSDEAVKGLPEHYWSAGMQVLAQSNQEKLPRYWMIQIVLLQAHFCFHTGSSIGVQRLQVYMVSLSVCDLMASSVWCTQTGIRWLSAWRIYCNFIV